MKRTKQKTTISPVEITILLGLVFVLFLFILVKTGPKAPAHPYHPNYEESIRKQKEAVYASYLPLKDHYETELGSGYVLLVEYKGNGYQLYQYCKTSNAKAYKYSRLYSQEEVLDILIKNKYR